VDRARVLKALHDAGVEAGIHYPIPIHLQGAYADLGLGPGSFPVTERLALQIFSLPIYPEMTQENVSYIARVLARSLAG
jgi:dTDP-4-amino-4,6-dideoxygalactose transaminase